MRFLLWCLHYLAWGAPDTVRIAPYIRTCRCGSYSFNLGSPVVPCPTLDREWRYIQEQKNRR